MNRNDALNKIRKLQALADAKRNPNAHERKLARRRIKELARRYQITAAEVNEQPPAKTARVHQAQASSVTINATINGKQVALSLDELVNGRLDRFFDDLLAAFTQ